ncbi:MAG: 2-amino-4-hydroxy-6-hydroxymethyldihydropteridine diphosphokinase [Gammaproteobacteria bacterium]
MPPEVPDPAAVRVFIGLGSNLEDPIRQVRTAFDELAGLPRTCLVRRSSLYETPPMGPPGQPHYINAVAELATSLAPHALLDALQAVETAHRRVRGTRWGPRTLDLDLLVYGDAVIRDARLVVPHPGIAARGFVLMPLAEIAPSLVIPGLPSPETLLARVDTHGICRAADP